MKTLPKPIEELNPPTEYLEEVLSTPPPGIARWGMTGLFILLTSLLLLSWLIRYPDRIEGEIILTTPSPPVAIVARSEGYLTDLQVVNRDTVRAGAKLGLIQNPTHYSDVLKLQERLNEWKVDEETRLYDSLTLPYLKLGVLQEPYSQLQYAHDAYQQHTHFSLYSQEQQLLKGQQDQYQILLNQKQAEKQLAQQVAQLAEKDFRRNKELYRTQAIAEKALEESEQSWLRKKQEAQALSSEVSGLQLSVQKLKREVLQLEKQYRKEEVSLRSDRQSALANLRAALQQWEERYVLKASVSGRISYVESRNHQDYLQIGDTILHILPHAEQSIIGKLQVPAQDFGKVREGQLVRVCLDQYPHQEFGRLQGEVVDWSELPDHEYYLITVQFPDELTTQYGKSIPFQQHLSGRAEVVTQPQRLLERIIHLVRGTLI
ncbi:MAG: HlyD family efflux transporter periplasmic adaptor subunit [Bacteroidota bacterium]